MTCFNSQLIAQIDEIKNAIHATSRSQVLIRAIDCLWKNISPSFLAQKHMLTPDYEDSEGRSWMRINGVAGFLGISTELAANLAIENLWNQTVLSKGEKQDLIGKVCAIEF